MNISSEVNDIVKQAPEWNFAGDCALLELMKRISENLKERGEHTSQKLREFETSVRTTDIALNNATNSLRSLQFGQQFVEYRIEEVDDDDFLIPETRKKKPLPPKQGPQEMAKEFLQNNLNMLRKNFEPVTLDVPDSDEDEDVQGAKEQTILYRPKNPYDAIPLPYIIGSKEWQEHKYAGLYESRENSEDEQSEEFSSSSSEENHDTRKTETNLSQSDSSSVAPLRIDPVIEKVKQSTPSPPKPAPEQTPRTQTQPRPIITSQTKRQLHEHDLFAALRQSPPSDDAPSTSSSMRSSPAFAHLPATDGGPSLSSSSSSAAIQPPPPKVFEKEELPKPLHTELDKEVVSKPSNPIKRMPVNLFNDDDFNSFMTEIVDKAQGKTTTAIEKKPTKESTKKVLEEQKPQTPKIEIKSKTTNLFDDSPPPSTALRQPVFQSPPEATPAVATVKPLPKSLFNDDLDDFDDDFLSSLTAKTKAKTKPIEQITKRTSLFDDDDDELDIDDIFTKKTLPTAKAKSAQFESETTPPSPPLVPMKKSLFDDIEDDEDIFGTPKTIKPLPKNKIEPPEDEQYQEEEDKMKPIEIASAEKPLEVTNEAKSMAKSINVTDLFNDDFSDDEINTVLVTNPSKIESINKEAEDEQHDKSVEKDGDDQEELFKDVRSFSDIPQNAFTIPPIDSKSNDLFQKSIENLDQDSTEILFVPPVDSAKPQVDPPTEAISDLEDDSVKGELFTEVPIDSIPILSDSPPPDIADERKEEDPIISMIAEVTSNRQNRNSSPSYNTEQVASAQKIMQNYTSLFDEPPDDTEFFSSLANSNLSSLSASKIFDTQDQDFFEPALPKVPSATKPTTTTSNSGIFSDVPPDDDADDDVDDNFIPTTTASVDVHGNTKRIHTIFYDDFSETARAGSTIGAVTPSLPIVDDAPLPQADEVDRHVPLVPPISPVKKLVMPNININVQALMPGPQLGRKIELPDPASPDNSLQHVNKTRVRGPAQRRPSTRRGRKENYAKTLQDEERQQVEKTKEEPSKVPAKVKPNFLDSDDDNDDSLFGSVKPTTTEMPKETPKISPMPASHLITKNSEVKKHVPFIKSQSKLFDDNDNDNVGSAKSSHQITKESEVKISAPPLRSQSKLFDDSDDDDLTKVTTQVSVKPAPQLLPKEPVQKKSAASVKTRNTLFDDSGDDDDDLFASAIPAPAATMPVAVKSTVTAKVTPHTKNVVLKPSKSLFSDDEDDDDDLFGVKTAKPTARKVVKPNVAATVTPSSSSSSKSIPLSTDNPLSDLLDK
ncbi:WASH complex subunit 2 [Drosophila tropicalis]|uniref:WASH complex subunit 2 n=1 Tax=Drosophila tropicalis TaxID=46794 RepID=UPI0035ABD8B5